MPIQVRKLQCGDIRIVKKYQRELKKLLDNRGISTRVDNLYARFQTPLTEEQKEEFERIDRYVTECCLKAEKRCRKVRAGNVPFSPIVDTAAKSINIWSLVLSKMRGCKVSSSLIKRLAKKCDIVIGPALTYEEVRKLRNNAIKRYKILKPTAIQHPERFISDLADVTEEVYGTKRGTAVRSLSVQEEERTISRQIRSKLKDNGGSISKLQIPNPDVPGKYTWTEDKNVIEESIIAANRKKFKLADDTPFRQDPLVQQCRTYANTESCREMLMGTYDTSNLDIGTAIYIRHLKVTDEILRRPQISSKISTEDLQDYWKNVREKTSSSPSGRHFGHWKSIAKSKVLS